jgi:hypothetical protein
MSRIQNDRIPKLPTCTSQNDIGIQIDYLKHGCEDGTRLGLSHGWRNCGRRNLFPRNR